MLPKFEFDKNKGFGKSLFVTWYKMTISVARFEGNFHLSITWA